MASKNNNSKKPEKKMWMRIAVLALAGIMFFGSVLSVFIFR